MSEVIVLVARRNYKYYIKGKIQRHKFLIDGNEVKLMWGREQSRDSLRTPIGEKDG